MNSEFRQRTFIDIDREDLQALLQIRFGDLKPEVQSEIASISDNKTLERLILVAANAASWDVFAAELEEGKDAFRMVGEAFNPLSVSLGVE